MEDTSPQDGRGSCAVNARLFTEAARVSAVGLLVKPRRVADYECTL